MPIVTLLSKFDECGPHLLGALEWLIQQDFDPSLRALYHISFSVELKAAFVVLAKLLVLNAIADLRHMICRI